MSYRSSTLIRITTRQGILGVDKFRRTWYGERHDVV